LIKCSVKGDVELRKKIFYFYVILFSVSCFQLCAQTYEGTSRSKRVSIQKGPKFPPYVEATISFYEPSGNNILDAEESGQITVNLKNLGKGKARGLSFSINPSSVSGIFFLADKEVGKLDPGEEINVKVPISAGFGVSSKKVSLNFSFSERNGFQPDPSILVFNTKAFVPPELIVLEGFDISDPDNNGIIESGEFVTITAAIQNIGQGVAKDVIVKLKVGENVFFGGNDIKDEFYFGILEPGTLKEFTFDVYTNKNAKEMPIFVTIDESYGKFGKNSFQLPLEFKKRLSNISEVKVVGIEDQSLGFTLAGEFGIDVDTNIPKSLNKNINAMAVIFGVEEYKNVSNVTYANRDASIMREYFEKILGIPSNRIYFKTNEDVSKAEFDKVFSRNGWLDKRVKEDKTDLYIYYAGHGAPDIQENKAYLIPYDGDPNYASQTGYEMNKLYDELDNLGAKSSTVFIDACFSGANRDNEMLLADARPVFMEVDATMSANVTVFSAAGGKEISSAWPEKKHGLFSYFLMKGMRGEADANNDNQITVGELGDYIKENVSDMAGMLDREQTPAVHTIDKDKVLIRF